MLHVFPIINYDCTRTLHILSITASCYMLTPWVIRFFVYYSVVHVTCKSFNGSFDMFLAFSVSIMLHVQLINHIIILR